MVRGVVAGMGLATLGSIAAPLMAAGAGWGEPAAETALIVSSGGQYAVTARVGDLDAVLAVDTAATTSGLTQSRLDALGLQPSGEAQVFGATGPLRVDLYDLPPLRIGAFEADSLRTPALPDFSEDLDGVVGVDVLRPFAVAFRPEAGVVALYDGAVEAAPADGWTAAPMTTLPFGFSFVDAAVDGVALRCLLDTGSSPTVINTPAAKALGLDLSAASDGATLSGAAGGASGSKVVAGRTVTLGETEIRDVSVSVADLAIFNARGRGGEPQCILGLSTVAGRDLIVDYPGQTLWLGP